MSFEKSLVCAGRGNGVTMAVVTSVGGLPAAARSHVNAGDILTTDLSAMVLVQPALEYLQHVVNEKLYDQVSPQLLPDPDRIRLGLRLVPKSLLGALWLQFAQAISEAKDYRQCLQCERWFEVSPSVARKSRLFCSNACRSKNYREKKEEAIRLHTQGMSLVDIAQRLKTDVDVAAGWVGLGGE